jgi:hypothetical protein
MLEFWYTVEMYCCKYPLVDNELNKLIMFYHQHRTNSCVTVREAQTFQPLAGAEDVGDVQLVSKPQVTQPEAREASECSWTITKTDIEPLGIAQKIAISAF